MSAIVVVTGASGAGETAAVHALACWAANLRGQADALDLAVLDTSALSVDDVAERLAGAIRELTVERAS